MNIYLFLTHAYRIILLSLATIMLSGCAATLPDYTSSVPEFDMQSFFNGKLSAYGIVQDRSGKVIRRFHADLIGQWQGNKGTLSEDFYYDDGETQRRVWLLTKNSDGSYSGTATDVTQDAFGYGQGFAFNWHYTLAIEVNGKSWQIDLNDWLYQLDDSRLINRTEMTKWGFKVGEITLVIEKTD
jgi:outer membrane biogenesis lipoprotein LolB